MRFRDKWVVGLVWVLVAVSVLVVDLGPVVSAAGPVVPPLQVVGGVSRFDLQLAANSSQTGQYIHYRNFAAFEWRHDLPDRPDGQKWKIIGEYGPNHMIVWYYDGSFRASNGAKWGAPSRWAYLRTMEEVWVGGTWMLPDGTAASSTQTVTLRADNLQGIVDYLMARNTVPAIQDAMDKSKEYFPKSGAPE